MGRCPPEDSTGFVIYTNVKGPRMMRGPLILMLPVSRDDPAAGADGLMLQNGMWVFCFYDTAHLSFCDEQHCLVLLLLT